MNKLWEHIQPYMEKGMAYQTALTLLEWDQETLAPMEAEKYTAKVVGELSDSYFQAMVNEEVKKTIKKLDTEKEKETLSEKEQALVQEWKRMIEQLSCIPQEEYKAYATLVAQAPGVWARAKQKNCFADFAPTLQEILEYKLKFARNRQKTQSGKKKMPLYDILLSDYEPGFPMEELDVFFEQLKKELIPLVQKMTEAGKSVDRSYQTKTYPIAKQKEFCRWVSGYLGFDFNRGVIGESAHPFTTNLHNHDVRISNHYYEDNLESAIFSAIHETGHALYEMGISDSITLTLLGTGTSMGMHESQSRFWENVIGRSEAFWKFCYPKLQETFPEQLKSIALHDFVRGINQVQPGLIRTEADELSYSLHIVVRYELEKKLIGGELDVADLEQEWAKVYEEYLGQKPKTAAEGVLQDIHWACGDFGYFPSYAIGTAVAAQLYAHLKEQMPLDTYLEQGNLTPIREYLKEHIYQYGKQKSTNELLEEITGEKLNVNYYLDYLREKYEALYEV